jgi:hypothetical protein
VEILQDAELRDRYRTSALAFARSITWEEAAETTVAVLEKAVRERRGKSGK